MRVISSSRQALDLPFILVNALSKFSEFVDQQQCCGDPNRNANQIVTALKR